MEPYDPNTAIRLTWTPKTIEFSEPLRLEILEDAFRRLEERGYAPTIWQRGPEHPREAILCPPSLHVSVRTPDKPVNYYAFSHESLRDGYVNRLSVTYDATSGPHPTRAQEETHKELVVSLTRILKEMKHSPKGLDSRVH